MLNVNTLSNLFNKHNETYGLINYLRCYFLDYYRSRVPFITPEFVIQLGTLVRTAITPKEDLLTPARHSSGYNRKLGVLGVCTDRNTVYNTADASNFLESALHSLSVHRPKSYVNCLFVNITNRAQLPAIDTVLTQYGDDIRKVSSVQTSIDGRAVESRLYYCYAYESPTYIYATNYWTYETNMHALHSMIKDLLTEIGDRYVSQGLLDYTVQHQDVYNLIDPLFNDEDITLGYTQWVKAALYTEIDNVRKQQILKHIEAFGDAEVVNVNKDLTDNICKCHEKIAQYEKEIIRLYDNIEAYTHRILSASQIKMYKTASEIFKGMLKNNIITDFVTSIGSNSSYIYWCVEMPFKYWEEDEAQPWLNTYQSDPYKQALFKAIFIDKVVKPWSSQWIRLDLKSGYVSNTIPNSGSYSEVYPPHPHIGYFNCFGNNSAACAQAIKNNDIETAITMCMNAAMQMNLGDYTVVNRFMKVACGTDTDYNYSGYRFLEFNNQWYSPIELRKWFDTHNETFQITETQEG